MGERTQYPPGTFCWTDLATTDQDAAKAFYTGLFGWEIEDMPVDGTTTYSMMRLDGRDVAALAPQPPEQRDAGVPPMWQSYVSVESADDAAARAGELGATVHAGPFDVLDAGRMAVVQDPQGAFVMVWEPRRHIGARLVNQHGALSWNELATTDLDAAASFYSEVFGWTIAPMEGGGQAYFVIKNGDANNGGMREVSPPDAPPHWLVYFGYEDLDTGLSRVQELGGTVLAGPIDLDVARIGVAQDPQGAVFALYAGQFEP
jgi:predicted enzyme related to lactoylglutathione lyase